MVVAAPFMTRIILAFYWGIGLGLPLGVPPGPEDPLLARVAPEHCLYYTTWAGMAKADPESPNRTEQLLAEKEVEFFLSETVSRSIRFANDVARRNGDASGVLMAELVPTLGKALLTRPAAIFVTDVDIGLEGVPNVEGAVVVKVADALRDVEAALGTIRNQIPRHQVTDVNINGKPFVRFQMNEKMPVATWGFHDDYLILGLGRDAIDDLLQRAESPPPEWLAEARDKLPVARRATLTYANIGAAMALTEQLPLPASAVGIFAPIRQANLRSYISVTGLDDTGFINRTLIEMDRRPKGLAAMLDAKPLGPDDLATIPNDSMLALAVRLDGTKLLDGIVELIRQIEPNAAQLSEMEIGGADPAFALKVRDDLLASLGDVWQLYTTPGDGGLITGWTLAVSVRDRAKWAETQRKLLNVLSAIPIPMRIKTSRYGDDTIYTSTFPDNDYLFAPSWCQSGDQLVIALFPQSVRAHLSRAGSKSTLALAPRVTSLLKADAAPIALAYRDSRAIFQFFYPLAQLAARVPLGELQREGLELDLTLLPSAHSVSRHLLPSVTSVHRTPDGLLIDTRQTIPSGSFGATAPILAAMTLPAVGSARQAAQRTQSMNNLKQMVVAVLNFESAFGAFPAAHNTDENGKPLLSWRVHILPFLEEKQLYEQFHFDEPWNSPHNRKLIRLMPNCYKAPGSMSDPGKTNYLGIRGPHGVFAAPAESENGRKAPRGTRIRNIPDGTSKTICLVEASDQMAVIWTKPDDFEPDEQKPIKGLVGTRRGGFIAAYCDGSCRFIAETVDNAFLNAWFTRDGAEVTVPGF